MPYTFKSNLVCLFVGLLFQYLALPAVASEVNTMTRVGYAYDPTSDQLLYVEKHFERHLDKMIVASEVQYLDAAGNEFASKLIRFGSDPLSPDFRLENTETGHIEGVTSEGSRREVIFRDRAGRELLRKTVAVPSQAIIDAGFDRFIETEWQSLVAGDVFVRPFLVPSLREFVDFRIRRDISREEDTAEHVFVMETASAWLRLLVEPILVTYEKKTQRLRRYQGLSNMRDASGNNYGVRIEFSPESS